MGSKEKLIERFKRLPKDFTFDEMVKLLEIYGFEKKTKEKHLVRVLYLRKKTLNR